ncbi:NADP-dependent oxidoreductase [Streptomyces sp. Isolate_219]|uniref:NADP-dependent oxidoreductase n=1 Tax=Streptomyces sp. Isolate_219 TaxID=2950110 RepID=UPI0021C7E155|nr:NADP-dependent oxidoreductase [Streptomyces sp. Isolate_219]MCR8575297.1 NADP-dependent oxidoreductase [Streptomyces sp. Isolate_219]
MTVPSTGTEVRLAARPEGWPTAGNFSVVQAPLPAVGTGQVLVRNLVMSVDPYMRGRMNNTRSYVPPFAVGKVLDGGAVGRVVVSKSPRHSVGDLVLHGLGWREYAVVGAAGAVTVDPALAPPGAYLGVLGMPGHAAYAGLLKAAEFRPGDTVFVSGAAGAVGSLVGQIARLCGAQRVIGSAGSAEKVACLTGELGFDAAFDYKAGPVLEQLAKAAPSGIDVYFDNVGGEQLDAALALARMGARFALCGTVSQINEKDGPAGPRNLVQAIAKGITLRGFLVSNYAGLKDEFTARMGGWLAEGRISYRETVVKGLENAPAAFIDMLRGANTGKMLVRIAD